MSPQRPIRIGNCSGVINDGIDQIYRLAKDGQVDAITGDYLAEFNIAWKAIEARTQPELGFEHSFLEQLSWNDGEAARLVAEKGIKIVHDGGALNPKGLAAKTDAYFKSLGLDGIKVAWVSGDDVKDRVKSGELGRIMHLDRKGVELSPSHGEVLAANVYTGQAGIVRALEEGADVVVCGRCTDASPVMGLASWWHGWRTTDFDRLACSLMAGHLIECGTYVTGGNYCGQGEMRKPFQLGFPITEIGAGGDVVITKTPGTNGIVTIDTCKAQLLYEIQGPFYLNPDVVADISELGLEQVGLDRVKLLGVKGLPPPPTTKLAICLLGGFQAEASVYAAGADADTDFRLATLREQFRRCIDEDDFTSFSIERYGTPAADPRSQRECTVQFRVFAQAPRPEAFNQFRRAISATAMQGFAGLHVGMDWRTMTPKPYVKYFPSLVAQRQVPLTVGFVGGSTAVEDIDIPVPAEEVAGGEVPVQPNYEPKGGINPSSLLSRIILPPKTVKRPLGDVVLGRSGDKGSNANMGFWVRDEVAWGWLRGFMTSKRIKELLGDDWNERYAVERCEFPGLWAVHFVVRGILQEGVSSSSVLDGFGKSMAEFVRARVVDLPAELVVREEERRWMLKANAGRPRL